MADQIVNHQCPSCTAPLRYDGGAGKLVCDYCGGSYETAEVEALYKEKEARASAAAQANSASSWNTGALSGDWGSEAGDMKAYTCPSCGAELICDETTAASCCPYCGNQTVIPGQFSGAMKPEYILPFKKDKEAAVAALKEHYKGKKLLPKAFVSDSHIDDIQGVYVPFWLFDCEGEGRMSFHCEQTETHDAPTERIEEKRHYTVIREGSLAFERVPADASKRMPDEYMDSIEPFDYGELKPFSTAYMPGFLADKYDEDSETCGRRMEERCKKALEESIKDTVTGYDSVRETEKNIIVKKGAAHYAMLPVWLLSTNWNGKNFLFAMNGQSGKLVGDLPVDMKKYFGFFGIISGAIIAVMMALQFLVFHLGTVAMILLCIALPLIIGLISVSVMKGKLKSVRTSSAAQYAKGGIKLSVREDRYINTVVKRTPKNTNNN